MTMKEKKRAAVEGEMHMHTCECFLRPVTMRHKLPGEIEAHNANIAALAGAPNYNREIIRALTQRVSP